MHKFYKPEPQNIYMHTSMNNVICNSEIIGIPLREQENDCYKIICFTLKRKITPRLKTPYLCRLSSQRAVRRAALGKETV